MCLFALNRQVIVLSLLLSSVVETPHPWRGKRCMLGRGKGDAIKQGLSPSHKKLWGFDGPSELAQIEGQRLGPPLPALTCYCLCVTSRS